MLAPPMNNAQRLLLRTADRLEETGLSQNTPTGPNGELCLDQAMWSVWDTPGQTIHDYADALALLSDHVGVDCRTWANVTDGLTTEEAVIACRDAVLVLRVTQFMTQKR